jgi:iron(III) transport system substrate-binding protein
MKSTTYPSPSSLTLGVLALAIAGMAAGASQAKPTTVEEVANYRGADRQAVLEAGARKEGNLLLYATGTQIKPLMQQFSKKYPFIKVQLQRANSTKTARKVLEEYKAGFYKVDGFELASHGLIPIRDRGYLQAFYSPEAKHYDKAAKDTKGFWIGVRESYGGIGYNTKLIASGDAPKTWKDLLLPRFKDKMAISSSTGTVGNWTGVLVLTYGEDFVRKLGKQNIKIFKMSSRALTNLVTSGEVLVAARASNAHIAKSLKKGAPLAWVDPGPVAVTDTVVALAKKAPHPHAMMLMADFLLSKEGQKMYLKLGYASARVDVKNDIVPSQKMYLANRPNFTEEFKVWVKLFNEVFRRKRR